MTTRKERQQPAQSYHFDTYAEFIHTAADLFANNIQARKLLDEKLAQELDTGQLITTCAKDVRPEKVAWVWDRRLPLGTFSLAAGKGGAAKSLHAVWLVSRLTTGRLDGCWKGETKGAVWVTLEASKEKEITPRLIVANADLDLVHFVTVQADDDPANDHIKIFDPRYIDDLRKIVEKKNIGMIVLDPALDVLDGKVNTKDQQDVRHAIGRINAFAEEMDILILGIAHFNKMNSVDDALDRITGSAAFSQRVRAALVFAYDDEADCFVVSQGKNNWGPLRQPNLAFTAQPKVIDIDGGIETIRLEWLDKDYEHSVSDILGKNHKVSQSKVDQAVEFLEGVLRGGPVLKKTVEAAAKEAQIAHSTLEKAYRQLGIKSQTSLPDRDSRRSRGAPPVTWELPEMPGF